MGLTFDEARHFLSRTGFGGSPDEIRHDGSCGWIAAQQLGMLWTFLRTSQRSRLRLGCSVSLLPRESAGTGATRSGRRFAKREGKKVWS